MLDLRERLLPEVDDEFAKSVGEVATVDELRTGDPRRPGPAGPG